MEEETAKSASEISISRPFTSNFTVFWHLRGVTNVSHLAQLKINFVNLPWVRLAALFGVVKP